MKYYRMKNPNWDGNSPDRQYRLAIVVEHNGEDHFMRIQTIGGVRSLALEPVSKHAMVPSDYLLDQDEFHRARTYYECFNVGTMTEITEEQIKAEETIDINSGFGWLKHDRKEAHRQSGGRSSSNSNSSGQINGGCPTLGSGKRVNQVGTFRSIDPIFSTPIQKAITEEELKFAQQMFETQVRKNIFDSKLPLPSPFNVEPDGRTTIQVGDETIEIKPGDSINATKQPRD